MRNLYYVYMYVCMYVCMYVSMYVCIYVYMYVHTHHTIFGLCSERGAGEGYTPATTRLDYAGRHYTEAVPCLANRTFGQCTNTTMVASSLIAIESRATTDPEKPHLLTAQPVQLAIQRSFYYI